MMPAAILRRAIWLVLLSGATLAGAQPASDLEILATDPAPDALLARQQPFYVRFAVSSAAPVTVTASGWFKGKNIIDEGGSGAPALLPRSGSGVVSLFYWGDRPTRIDEVRLHVTDARSGAKINDYAFPVTLTWLSDEPPLREPAAWVREWQQASNPPGAHASDDATASLPSWWLALGAAALVPAGALLWRRRRRRAASADGRADR